MRQIRSHALALPEVNCIETNKYPNGGLCNKQFCNDKEIFTVAVDAPGCILFIWPTQKKKQLKKY